MAGVIINSVLAVSSSEARHEFLRHKDSRRQVPYRNTEGIRQFARTSVAGILMTGLGRGLGGHINCSHRVRAAWLL